MEIELYQKLKDIGTELTPKMIESTIELLSPLALKLSSDVIVKRDLKYGPHERNRLDVFSKKNSNTAPKPAFIYVHGGGFVAGDKGDENSTFYNNVGAWSVAQEWVGITLNYRLAPEFKWPSVAADLELAIDWIVENAEFLNIDTTKIVLCGQSAGAVHVASYLVRPKAEKLISATVLVSGIYDLVNDNTSPMEESYFGTSSETYESASTVNMLAQSKVPCVYAVAELDPEKFQYQSYLVVKNTFEKQKKWPTMLYLAGHNHLSPMLLIGTQNDGLGKEIVSYLNRLWLA